MVSVSITSVSAGKLGDSKAGLSSYTCTQVPGALIYCVCLCVFVHCGPPEYSWKASEQERGLKGAGLFHSHTPANDDRFLEASLSLKTRQRNEQRRFMGILF